MERAKSPAQIGDAEIRYGCRYTRSLAPVVLLGIFLDIALRPAGCLRRPVGSSKRIARMERANSLIDDTPAGRRAKRAMSRRSSPLSTSPCATRFASTRKSGTGFPISHGSRHTQIVHIAREASCLIRYTDRCPFRIPLRHKRCDNARR